MKKVHLIIDGSNLAYRQQYGLSINLETKDGESTTVIYGFLRSLLKLKKDFKVASFWVVWDGSSRNKKLAFDDYKGQRTIDDQKLAVYDQITKLKEILGYLGINQVFLENEEADDVIASLACSYLKDSLCYIYSNDKDFLQLVRNGSIIVLSPKKGGVYHPYDEEEVFKKFGIPIELLCDFRAFDGDPSDNIPRCPNLRRQIIIEMLNRFGSLDGIYNSNFYGLSAKDYERVKDFEAQARLNLQIMTLNKALPLKENINLGSFDADKLKSYLHQYEIYSININELAELFTGKIPFYKSGIQAITL